MSTQSPGSACNAASNSGVKEPRASAARSFRIRGGDGSHEAVFVVAHELVAEKSAVFNAANMGQARQRRHAAQYIDVDRPTEIDEVDARRVADWANKAVVVAGAWLRQ